MQFILLRKHPHFPKLTPTLFTRVTFCEKALLVLPPPAAVEVLLLLGSCGNLSDFQVYYPYIVLEVSEAHMSALPTRQ